MISNLEDSFVETKFFKLLQEEVVKNGVVTLTGITGEGKTTMAIMMCKKLKKEGYFPAYYENVDAVQTDEIARMNKDMFIVIDDFLGKSALDVDEKERHEKVLYDINQVKLKREREKVGERKPLLLLLVSRDNVYEQAVKEVPHLKRPHRQNVSSRTSLEDSERKMFLEKYSRKAARKLTSDEIDVVLKAACPLAFPKMCQLYEDLGTAKVDPVYFFLSPEAAMQDAIHEMMNKDSSIKAALALLLVEEVLPMQDLENPESKTYKEIEKKLQTLKKELPLPARAEISPFYLAESFEGMCKGLLQKECGFIGFGDRSVNIAVSLALARDHVAFVARRCSFSFIAEHLHVSDDTSSVSPMITLKKEQWDFLVDRLVEEVKDKNLKGAFTCALNQHSQFLVRFVNCLTKSQSFSEVVHSRDKEEDLCFLFWMSLTPSPNFMNVFRRHCFNSTEIWQAICGFCISGGASEIQFLYKKLEATVNWERPLSYHHQNKSVDSSSPNFWLSLQEATPGALAAASGHLKVLEKLIQLGMSVNAVNSLGQTPLMHATMAGQRGTVEFLVDKHKADTEIPDQSGCKPLHWAIQLCHTKIVETLIQRAKEANDKEKWLNMANASGQTLLMLACGNMPEVALELLDLGAKTDQIDKQGRSCLHYACSGGDSELIRTLKPHDGMDGMDGINVNAVDKYGISPLHQACWEPGNQEVVRVLLDARADPQLMVKGTTPLTPLHLASMCDIEIVKILLEKMENFEEPDSMYLTPLAYACLAEKTKIVKLFLDKGGDVILKDKDENTVLHLASKAGSASVVDLLVEKCPSLLNVANSASQTPFFSACAYGHQRIARALIKKDIDVDKRDTHGRNALHAAASVGSLEIVKLLLEETPLDINSKDKMEMTPLMFACFHAKPLVACHLVDLNADTNCSDGNGHDALHFAAADGNTSALFYTTALKQGSCSCGREERYDILPRSRNSENKHDNGGGITLNPIGITEHLQDKNCIEDDMKKNDPMLFIRLTVCLQRYLIKKGAKDHAANTALYLENDERLLPNLNYLVEKVKLPMKEKSDKSETPLQVAIRKKSFSVNDFLAEHSAGLPDKAGNYPLHTAAKAGNISVAGAILNIGLVPVDIRNEKEETPLQLANQAGMADMARYLIKRGASEEDKKSFCTLL